MYKARFTVLQDSLRDSEQKIYVPILCCYRIHSVIMIMNGVTYEEDNEIFNLELPYIKWIAGESSEGFKIDRKDTIRIEVNYHYKNSIYDPVCANLASNIISKSWFCKEANSTLEIEDKRKEIFIKHYINGQFSLDSGLCKEAVLNFGTVLEVILNKKLSYIKLEKTIEDCLEISKFQDEMHKIRNYRNKVHPNKLKEFSDINRHEAQECRIIIENILNYLELNY